MFSTCRGVLNTVTCYSISRRVFGLDIRSIDHLWIPTTTNYNSLTEPHTPTITTITAHTKVSRPHQTPPGNGPQNSNYNSLTEPHTPTITTMTAHTKVPLLHQAPLFAARVSELYYDRRSVGQSVLVSSTHLGLTIRFFITVRQLRVCWCEAPSLARGRVCLLLCTMYNMFTFYMLSCVIHSLT
jgi:hypothetical protein